MKLTKAVLDLAASEIERTYVWLQVATLVKVVRYTAKLHAWAVRRAQNVVERYTAKVGRPQ